jgi:N-acetylmuramate 1-kinase
MIFTDERLALLKDWLNALPAQLALNVSQLKVASSDASFRRYLRLPTQNPSGAPSVPQSYIVMDAPPSHEDCRPFARIAKAMEQAGVPTPTIVAQDLEQGFLLLTDFGDVTFLSKVVNQSQADATPLYSAAIDHLIHLQTDYVDSTLLPYDKTVLLRELMLYPDWYITQYKGVTLSDKERATLMAAFELIIENNLAQPVVAVHRDYHSRNLMVLEADGAEGVKIAKSAKGMVRLGIIDFQDALNGPITYDLISLLRDAYIEWREPEMMDWAISYWERARKRGLPVSDQFGEFYRDLEWMGIQRHIKVLGIFARLAIRDGKHQYLADMPLVMRYCMAAVKRYAALGPLSRLMAQVEGEQAKVGYTF